MKIDVSNVPSRWQNRQCSCCFRSVCLCVILTLKQGQICPCGSGALVIDEEKTDVRSKLKST